MGKTKDVAGEAIAALQQLELSCARLQDVVINGDGFAFRSTVLHMTKGKY